MFLHGRVRTLFPAIVALGLMLPFAAAALEPADFIRCVPIRAVGASATAVADHPVPVRISTARIACFDYGEVAADGSDIRFFDSEGSLLVHEIESWDASGESIVWVKLPELKKLTRFYFCYLPRTGVTLPPNDPAAVWTKYVGVWHLNEPGTGATARDSTVNGYDAVDTNVTAQLSSAADGCPVGRGRRLAGGELDTGVLHLKSDAAAAPLNSTTQFTVSGWMRCETSTAGFYSLVAKGRWGVNNASWWGWGLNTQGSFTTLTMTGAGEDNSPYSGLPTLQNSWVYLTCVYNGNNTRLYVNGVTKDAWAKSARSAPGDNSVCSMTLFRSLVGCGDEVRIRNGAISEAEAVDDYKAQLSSSGFLRYGAILDPSTALFDYGRFFKSVTFTTVGAGADTLYDFPVPVRISSDAIPGFDFSSVAENGADLRFYEAGGAVLDHEIEKWDPEGESLVWVKLPVMNASTSFIMCWQPVKGAALPSVNPRAIWNKFVGVWHLGEAADGATARDSSTNRFDAVDMNAAEHQSTVVEDGPVGRARRFTGAGLETGVTRLGDAALAAPLADVTRFEVSGWMRIESATAASWRFVRKGAWGSSLGAGYWGWACNTQNSLSDFTIYGGGSTTMMRTGCSMKDNWVYLTCVFNGTTAALYENGAIVGNTGDINAASDTSLQTLQLFCELVGAGDEVRIRNGLSSDAERQADYRAQLRGSGFLSVGRVRTRLRSKTMCRRALVTTAGATQSGLRNFPVLVRISSERIAGFSYDRCGSQGENILFTDVEGHVLPHEIDAWNPAGESAAWVSVPELNGANTSFYLYWYPRHGATPPSESSSNVWADASYLGVWHMDEVDGFARDATGNGFDAIVAGGSSTVYDGESPTVGKVHANSAGGYGMRLEGATNSLFKLGSVFSVSGLYRASSVEDAKRTRFAVRKQAHNSGSGFMFNMQSDQDGRMFYLSGSGDGMAYPSGGGGMPSLPVDISSVWAHVTMSWNGSSVAVYVNGSAVSMTFDGAAPADDYTCPFQFCGAVGWNDEIRVRKATSSAAWAKAEYETMTKTDFCVFSAAENCGPRGTILFIR